MSERCDLASKSRVRLHSGTFSSSSGTFSLGVRLLAALMIAFATTAGAFFARAAVANPAEAFVQENIDMGYSILNNAKLSESDRHGRFRRLLGGLMDTRRIGIFTLGQYANSSSKADIDAFTAAFADYTIAVYETRLNKFKEQILKVTGSSARAADDVVVNCEATDPAHPNNAPYKVAFRIRKASDGRFVITDLNLEGVWQTLSQRADFTGFLQQHGGKLQELTTDLKRQTQQVNAHA